MEGKILERRIPRDEVVYDRGDAWEGKNAEDDDLHFPSAAFEYKVKRCVQRDSENKTEYMRGAKGTPSHDRNVSFCHFLKKSKPIIWYHKFDKSQQLLRKIKNLRMEKKL